MLRQKEQQQLRSDAQDHAQASKPNQNQTNQTGKSKK
jgi:hypothetical protein